MPLSSRTPDDYFLQLPEDRRDHLGRLRSLIKQTWPKVKEDLSYGMPTYHLGGHVYCAIANQKHYMVLYLMPYDLLDAFKMELKAYNCGRSCIRFRKLDDEKTLFFERVLKYTGDKFPDSRFHGKTSPAIRAQARA